MLVDEAFASQDDRFIEFVRTVQSIKYLAGLADRWKKDPRPWAREQIFKYLEFLLDRPGHHPIVKRLFKQAEANRDDELMGVFLVVFDRLIRRQRRTRYRYDFRTRQSWQEEELFSPRDQLMASAGQKPGYFRLPKGAKLFTYTTRKYLRRRVWRYFRRAGFQRPADYTKITAAALARYTDADVARGEHILDSWALMQIAFRSSSVLSFKRSTVELATDCTLAGLIAAPRFPTLWHAPEAAAVLLDLLNRAKSRLVRVWTMQLLKQAHAAALRKISVEQLLKLLEHGDEEVQSFGAALLADLEGIDRWPVSNWLLLLETKSITALGTICDSMKQLVKPERLTLEQCVALTNARPTPVARLGFEWLSQRAIASDQDREALKSLSSARCDAVASEAAQFALQHLGAADVYRTDHVSPFFDSLNSVMRKGAWTWLVTPSHGYHDPLLWTRLLETPYDDIRIALVNELSKRESAPKTLERQDLTTVWVSVLLAVRRGSRAKVKALRQISQAIATEPDRAEQLVPVLAVAIRSVRPPEVRAGLAAILTAIEGNPDLEASLFRWIPELRLLPLEAAR